MQTVRAITGGCHNEVRSIRRPAVAKKMGARAETTTVRKDASRARPAPRAVPAMMPPIKAPNTASSQSA